MDTLTVDASRSREESRNLKQAQAGMSDVTQGFSERLKASTRKPCSGKAAPPFWSHTPSSSSLPRVATTLDEWFASRQKERESERVNRRPGRAAARLAYR